MGVERVAWGKDELDGGTIEGVVRVQEWQFAIPVLGMPAVSVTTGIAGAVPMGVQMIGPRFREDLVLDAAELIESRCPPLTPIDPR